MINMTVKILRYPIEQDWLRCKQLALGTMGKTSDTPPTDEWRIKILKSEHSPIRTLMFTIELELPYYISTHFVRHKHGVEHYVKSQRNDRQSDYDRRSARQDEMVSHIMDINAQALINMAHARLCRLADPVAQEVMQSIKQEVIKVCPCMSELLVPKCEYRGGLCDEFNCCGYNRRVKSELRLLDINNMDKFDIDIFYKKVQLIYCNKTS